MAGQSVQIDLIWGNNEGTQTYACARDENGTSLIFRVTRDAAQHQSLASRIVVCFHDIASEPHETFQTRDEMRTALRNAVLHAWPECIHAAGAAPDMVVDLYNLPAVCWTIRRETSLYRDYLGELLPAGALLNNDLASPRDYEYVNRREITTLYYLPGRGTSAVVRRTANATTTGSLYVLKSVDFSAFLESKEETRQNLSRFYHAIRTVMSIPPHPHIIPPPRTIVVAEHPESDSPALVCGTLYPFMPRGTLDDLVKHKAEGTRLGLLDKARWCLELSSALEHTHHVAHTYHVNIKPSNVLIDDQGRAILIDWEQSGAHPHTLAPEANGEWDASSKVEGRSDSPGKLVYTRYCGPNRVNSHDWPAWNVFPEWSKRWPAACEAAEVFSLGRTLWMLLEEVPERDVEAPGPGGLRVEWSEDRGIPDHWKAIVMRCQERDPNERIGLTDLVRFWEGAREELLQES